MFLTSSPSIMAEMRPLLSDSCDGAVFSKFGVAPTVSRFTMSELRSWTFHSWGDLLQQRQGNCCPDWYWEGSADCPRVIEYSSTRNLFRRLYALTDARP